MYGIGVLAFIFRGSVELQGPYLPVWAVWPDFEGGVCSAMTGQVPGPTSGTPPPRVARKRIVYPTPPYASRRAATVPPRHRSERRG
jgi:hypothetical protein